MLGAGSVRGAAAGRCVGASLAAGGRYAPPLRYALAPSRRSRRALHSTPVAPLQSRPTPAAPLQRRPTPAAPLQRRPTPARSTPTPPHPRRSAPKQSPPHAPRSNAAPPPPPPYLDALKLPMPRYAPPLHPLSPQTLSMSAIARPRSPINTPHFCSIIMPECPPPLPSQVGKSKGAQLRWSCARLTLSDGHPSDIKGYSCG